MMTPFFSITLFLTLPRPKIWHPTMTDTCMEMKREKIHRAFSFDRHFEFAGFDLVP